MHRIIRCWPLSNSHKTRGERSWLWGTDYWANPLEGREERVCTGALWNRPSLSKLPEGSREWLIEQREGNSISLKLETTLWLE